MANKQGRRTRQRTVSVRARGRLRAIRAGQTRPAKVKVKIRRPITLALLRNGIRNSLGNKGVMCKRIGCGYSALNRAIRKYEDKVVGLLQEEREKPADLAELAISDLLKQRMDYPTLARVASWVLSRTRYADRGFMDAAKKVEVQGGEKPIKIQAMVATIDALKLPIEVRKQILETVREAEATVVGEGEE